MSERNDSDPTTGKQTEYHVVEQRAYDPADGSDLTTVIIEAVATADGVEKTSIREPPLYEVVDIAAVKDALFGGTEPNIRGATGSSFDFEYRRYRITVRGDGWVQVAEPAQG
ncbi:HalOD1 output domain-containing protein [Halobaculum magnesiiphilum]|uniref:Halobacterial output domain-containing protein n=1 Tax=Halobaculum magnesiiphilum TaxID=1017351 RepID=A0A8T8WID7_9EURY|nr:HalOD1 output domain-containing protein [Halobaculum magnesiiphilum]QZP39556.1 hypothetical protein K6T50_18490 [Halobaculum magnesiiphilum]